MAERDREVADTEGFLPVYTYRCVCGCDILVDRRAGGSCEGCGRAIASTIIEHDPAVTIVSRGGQFNFSVGTNQTQNDSGPSRGGEVLGHYRIVDALGSGGMGTVYRALDESLQRYVALKVMRESTASHADSRSVQRLLQEAIAQARVNHPNIVHIYYVGSDGRSPFFAMELVNGQTMAQRIKSSELSFSEIIDYAQQIASALKHAAELDILHGDIKPANILVNNTNTIKLSDFGLARRLSEIATESNELSGTPDYLSPEAIDGEAIDVRSDIYSFGVTLFEMTFRRVPYADSGRTLIQRLQAHQQHSVDFPEPWPKHIPQVWQFILANMLNKKPAERYPNYDALLADLAHVKPNAFQMAARVPRAVAWIIDLGLANAAQGILVGPIGFLLATSKYNSEWPLQLGLILLSCVVPLLASFLQSTWKKTPGKSLLQLRIIDRHGLTPSKSVLFGRAAVQLLPIWAGAAYQLFHLGGSNYLALAAVIGLVGFSVLDAGYACINRNKKSIHDVLFRTRVVLDTQGS
jgi:serine/threonine protein kinase